MQVIRAAFTPGAIESRRFLCQVVCIDKEKENTSSPPAFSRYFFLAFAAFFAYSAFRFRNCSEAFAISTFSLSRIRCSAASLRFSGVTKWQLHIPDQLT